MKARAAQAAKAQAGKLKAQRLSSASAPPTKAKRESP